MFVGLGRVEEFEVLLRRSESFYVTALLQAERGMYDLAVFSLEQSLQLFLKAALLKKGVDFPRTHGVRRLLNMLAELTGSDEIKQLQTSLGLELGILEDSSRARRLQLCGPRASETPSKYTSSTGRRQRSTGGGPV
jgi:HEPN domain-containing protein